MRTRSGLLLLVTSLVILPGSHLLPLNVVFQPETYQLTPIGVADPDFTPAFPTAGRESSAAESLNPLICKKIHHGEGIFQVAPSTTARYLFFKPSPGMQPVTEDLFHRYLIAIPSVSSAGINAADIASDIPEQVFAPTPPMIASLCVSQDSPRPFPVLFAPPPPNDYSLVDNDFRREISPFGKLFSTSTTPEQETPLKVNINTAAVGEVTLGIHGVPATVESSSPSWDAPGGRILVKLHTNPPGSITLGLAGDRRTPRVPDSLGSGYGTLRGTAISSNTQNPTVSLVFSRPVGSIGIGAANSPAVNIEKQSIVASSAKSP